MGGDWALLSLLHLFSILRHYWSGPCLEELTGWCISAALTCFSPTLVSPIIFRPRGSFSYVYLVDPSVPPFIKHCPPGQGEIPCNAALTLATFRAKGIMGKLQCRIILSFENTRVTIYLQIQYSKQRGKMDTPYTLMMMGVLIASPLRN